MREREIEGMDTYMCVCVAYAFTALTALYTDSYCLNSTIYDLFVWENEYLFLLLVVLYLIAYV